MEKQELIDQVNEVLAEEFEVEVSEITPDANIKATLQLDSLSLVDMVALIESTFSVKIQNSELSSIQTFANLYDFISARMSK
ncbi:MAG: phosphopantetheine-binding protein [Bacteroidales bacterium]|nr:phosphopantetheine-binding protein [Bacteroidales bacterium]